MSIKEPLDQTDLSSQAPATVLAPEQELGQADQRILETSEFKIDPAGQTLVVRENVERVVIAIREDQRPPMPGNALLQHIHGFLEDPRLGPRALSTYNRGQFVIQCPRRNVSRGDTWRRRMQLVNRIE